MVWDPATGDRVSKPIPSCRKPSVGVGANCVHNSVLGNSGWVVSNCFMIQADCYGAGSELHIWFRLRSWAASSKPVTSCRQRTVGVGANCVHGSVLGNAGWGVSKRLMIQADFDGAGSEVHIWIRVATLGSNFQTSHKMQAACVECWSEMHACCGFQQHGEEEFQTCPKVQPVLGVCWSEEQAQFGVQQIRTGVPNLLQYAGIVVWVLKQAACKVLDQVM